MSVASRSIEYARAIGRLVARAVAPMVEDDDGVVACERRNVVGEVFLRAAEAMDQEQTRTRSRDLDRQPDPVTRRDPHAPWSR